MSFISFSCLIAQSRFSGTMLTKSDGSGHSCLVFDLSFHPVTTVHSVSCGLVICGFHYIEACPFYTQFVEFLV